MTMRPGDIIGAPIPAESFDWVCPVCDKTNNDPLIEGHPPKDLVCSFCVCLIARRSDSAPTAEPGECEVRVVPFVQWDCAKCKKKNTTAYLDGKSPEWFVCSGCGRRHFIRGGG